MVELAHIGSVTGLPCIVYSYFFVRKWHFQVEHFGAIGAIESPPKFLQNFELTIKRCCYGDGIGIFRKLWPSGIQLYKLICCW